MKGVTSDTVTKTLAYSIANGGFGDTDGGMTTEIERQRERTACHEAGHAIAHVVLGGGEIVARLLDGTRGRVGEVVYVRRGELCPRDRLVMLAAGPQAEARFTGCTVPVTTGTSASDGESIRDAIQELRRGDYNESALRRLPFVASAEAHEIVRDRWAAIRAVAERLLTSGQASYFEILAICRVY